MPRLNKRKMWEAIKAQRKATDDFVANYQHHREEVVSDPLKPSLPLLCKLGSIAVHAEEFLSPKRHALDLAALKTLLEDEEIRNWIKGMGVYMPVKR